MHEGVYELKKAPENLYAANDIPYWSITITITFKKSEAININDYIQVSYVPKNTFQN